MVKLETAHTTREYKYIWKTPQGVKSYSISIVCKKEDAGLIGAKGLANILIERVEEYCKEKGITA